MSKKLDKQDHLAILTELIKKVAHNRSVSRVFTDFLEMFAITIANSSSILQDSKWNEREKRYLELIHSYGEKHRKLFPDMFAHLVLEMNKRATSTGPEDVLGPLYFELGLSNKFKAQVFIPQHLSDFMAQISLGAKGQESIDERGYITMAEPACGSGVMVISMCKAMQNNNLNYNTQLLVSATDIDIVCVHMAYVQLSLYGVPAVVIHGNTLTLEEWSKWYTPLYTLHRWKGRYENN